MESHRDLTYYMGIMNEDIEIDSQLLGTSQNTLVSVSDSSTFGVKKNYLLTLDDYLLSCGGGGRVGGGGGGGGNGRVGGGGRVNGGGSGNGSNCGGDGRVGGGDGSGSNSGCEWL